MHRDRVKDKLETAEKAIAIAKAKNRRHRLEIYRQRQTIAELRQQLETLSRNARFLREDKEALESDNLRLHQEIKNGVSMEEPGEYMLYTVKRTHQELKKWTGLEPEDYELVRERTCLAAAKLTLKAVKRRKIRSMKLPDEGQLLLTLIWLRHNLTYTMLASLFRVDQFRVPDYLHRTLVAMHQNLNFIRWPSEHEMNFLLVKYEQWLPVWMSNGIFIIDGTEWRIRRPAGFSSASPTELWGMVGFTST